LQSLDASDQWALYAYGDIEKSDFR